MMLILRDCSLQAALLVDIHSLLIVNNFVSVAGTTVTASSTQVATASASYTASFTAPYATATVTATATGSSTATVTSAVNVRLTTLYDLMQTGFILLSTALATAVTLGASAEQKKSVQLAKKKKRDEAARRAAELQAKTADTGGWGFQLPFFGKSEDDSSTQAQQPGNNFFNMMRTPSFA